ncbi:MAG TPA: phosphopantetheine-binding protein, partial [Streptosporangiaceae bacterium]|nr:phosphopantetheine-binding protein [Streptosporangiaceae bacterium]
WPEAAGGPGRLRAELAERLTRLLALVREAAATVLGHQSPESIRPDLSLLEGEFDSLSTIELRVVLVTATGLDLPATVVFDHPTPLALAEHLRVLLAASPPAEPAPVLAGLDGREPAGTGLDLLESAVTELDRLESALLDGTLLDGSGPDGSPPDGSRAGGTGPAAAWPEAAGGPGRLRAELAERLTRLLALVDAGREDPAGEFADATDDQIFDFIDNQLGVS